MPTCVRSVAPVGRRWPTHSAAAGLTGPNIREYLDPYPVLAEAPIFADAVDKPLRRILFRSRVWRSALDRAGMLDNLTVIDDNTVRAGWKDDAGATLVKSFATERKPVLHIAKSDTSALRFHALMLPKMVYA